MRRLTTFTAAIIAVGAVALIAQGPPAGRQGAPGRQGGAPAGRGGFFPRPASLPFPTAAQTFDGLQGVKFRVVPHVTGLQSPWGIGFLPTGEMLVTEKAGRLRIVRNGVLEPTPVSGTPMVVSAGQGALMDVLPHPRFAENRLLYITYSKAGDGGNTTALMRGRLEGNALVDAKDIFVADAWSQGQAHFGSKLAWGRDGTLLMTVGERNDRTRAQLLTTHAGKVLRLRDDGTVPPDNPFVGRADARPEIYSYGHRNLQGLAVHPETGAIWQTEHGPQGGDELNVVLAGRNYGWPIATMGREYTGEIISASPAREGIEQPFVYWVPSIGLSGLTIYTGDKFPQWKGSILVGGLSGLELHRVAINERGLAGRESLLRELRLRVRDVRQGPDGNLYLAIDDAKSGILRIEPAG